MAKKLTGKSVDVAALLAKGKADFAYGGPKQPQGVQYTPIKRAGDRQMMITKDNELVAKKKKLDKQIENLNFKIGGEVLANARQEGISPREADKLYAQADVLKKQLDGLKAERKKLGK
jgi:predicted Ser/Thr protein kinase